VPELRHEDLRGMAMTRRKFTAYLMSSLSSVGVGLCGLARAVRPRRFVRALRRRGYPGKLVPMPDVRKRGTWSG